MKDYKVKDLVKEVNSLNEIIQSLGLSKKIVEKEIKKFGNGGHIILSKELVNRKVKILIEGGI